MFFLIAAQSPVKKKVKDQIDFINSSFTKCGYELGEIQFGMDEDNCLTILKHEKNYSDFTRFNLSDINITINTESQKLNLLFNCTGDKKCVYAPYSLFSSAEQSYFSSVPVKYVLNCSDKEANYLLNLFKQLQILINEKNKK